MRDPSSRIQIGWFSMKRECNKHTYEAFKTMVSLKIKLLHFSLRITRLRSRRCFKRWTYLQKRLTQWCKSIHLALEVKTFFGNSTTAMGPSIDPALRSMDFPWTAVISNTERERRSSLHMKKLQSNAWAITLRKTDPTWPSGQLLDMTRLQVVKTIKHATTSFNLFYSSFSHVKSD
jgi:hypothetical protein